MHISAFIKNSIYNHGHSQKIDAIKSGLIRKVCMLIKSLVWSTVHIGYFVSKEKYFPRFELLLSRSCPFNCKCCIHFLPEYTENVCEPAELVIQDMTKLLSAIEQIDELIISGGDAFSYPQLAEVVEFLSRSEKIGKITIVSTGAVSPDKNVLKLMKNNKINIKVENYEGYSDKIDEFSSLPYENVHIISYDTWQDFGDESCKNRVPEELEKQYSSCNQERYCLLNGKIYACPRSAHGENLGFFINDEKEYVNLRKAENKKDILSGIKSLRNISYLTSCNYCNCRTELYKDYSLNVRFKDGSKAGKREII